MGNWLWERRNTATLPGKQSWCDVNNIIYIVIIIMFVYHVLNVNMYKV